VSPFAAGGDRLKFSDVITAVASLMVVELLLDFVFLAVFVVLVNPYLGTYAAAILSFLVSSLIVGYLYAVKIQEESRIEAIAKIVVLSAVVVLFYVMVLLAANPYFGAEVNEGLRGMFSTSGWTTRDWLGYSQLTIVMLLAVNVVLSLVLSFIGLYFGSMLRKLKKS
jgi:hypothetical protein